MLFFVPEDPNRIVADEAKAEAFRMANFDLPCWIKSCKDYIEDPKYAFGFCKRVRIGYPMVIRHEYITLEIGNEKLERIVPACGFYRSSKEKMKT